MANALRAVMTWERAARPAVAVISGILSLCLSVGCGLGLIDLPPRVVAAVAFCGMAGALFSAAHERERRGDVR